MLIIAAVASTPLVTALWKKLPVKAVKVVLPVVILASVYAGVKLYGFGGILLGPLSVLLIKELWRQVDAAAEKELERAREL